MKKIVTLFLFLIYCSLQSQSLSIFDIDTSAFPTIRAKFWAFDKDGNQITNLSAGDFQVTENGVPRTITRVSCPPEQLPQIVSIAMSIDVSGSMSYSRISEIHIELGRITVKELCKLGIYQLANRIEK